MSLTYFCILRLNVYAEKGLQWLCQLEEQNYHSTSKLYYRNDLALLPIVKCSCQLF